MIEAIAALIMIWLGYKLLKASTKQKAPTAENITYGIPFGYYKAGEKTDDLI